MNKVNPLYTLAVLVVLILFLLFKIGALREELRESKSDYAVKKEIATKLVTLQKLSADRASLIRYAKNAHGFKVTQTPKNVTLHAEALNKAQLDRVVGKILNNAYWIEKMKIKKLDDQKASLEMEIVW